ncbi:Parathyroid hormone/parathyroid hormone-related peptide receptor [Mactra antiquata]
MTVVSISVEEQEAIRRQKALECYTLMQEELNDTSFGCSRTWDQLLCWPPTMNGTVATLPCPNYVDGFQPNEMATRICDSNGEWWIPPDRDRAWTNLTLCSDSNTSNPYVISEILAAHMPRLRLMYNIGYGISLASLVIAVIIMLYFKRLHCPRNTIHVNLFMSFIFRATISFIKENALVKNVGFSFDLEVTENQEVHFYEDSSHWQCKTFFSMFNYIIGASYMWIFTEGIYLHMLITAPMFSERSGVKKFITFGWGAPIFFVVPWVIVRATLEDVLCWNTHPTHGYRWLIRAPIVTAMVINFFIFLNIIRVLFTKLNAFNTPDVNRKLAKSTLVLIPLFGVHYMVFIGLPDEIDETTELVKLYYEMFFNSFQGFIVSLLFCFMNGEVQAEIKKKWNRYFLKRGGNFLNRRPNRDTMTTFVSRPRGSVGSSNDRDLPNGKYNNHNRRKISLSTDNSDNTDKKEGPVLENGTSEYHAMVDLPSPSQKYDESLEPILNNNVNCVHNVNVDVG